MSENIEVDNSLHGACPKLGKLPSMENMEFMKLTPEKIQNWNSEILAKQKLLIAKPFEKLLFVNRLKGKTTKPVPPPKCSRMPVIPLTSKFPVLRGKSV
jgi:G-protein signaling modulator 2